MPIPHGPEGVLVTGVFGAGKTSVVEEMAEMLEHRGASYAALDLDWLTWFQGPNGSDDAGFEVLLRNLTSVADTYLEVGVRCFLLAHAFDDRAQLERVRAELSFPVRVVRLTVPFEEIERRLATSVTSGRADDLERTRALLRFTADADGDDVAVTNHRSIGETAREILEHLGWE